MYTLYWVSTPGPGHKPDEFMVMAADYESIASPTHIPDTMRVVSGNHTKPEAERIADARQLASYGERRRNAHG